MRAEVALGGRVRVRINIQSVVGAGFAADATIGIEINNAVVAAIEGRDRADRDARRELAVVAPHHAEQPAVIREFALLDVFDPGAIDAQRHLMLAFTGDGTGMAPN